MNGRERILARIREALRVTAPKPGSHGGHHHEAAPAPAPSLISGRIPLRPVQQARAWLPPGGDSPAEHLERFAAASADLKTDFHRLPDVEAVREKLSAIASAEGWQQVATHRSPLTDAVVPALGIPSRTTDGGYDPEDLERCDAGITTCDVLVAQTGTLVVNSRTTGGRALSVLPPHHVVLARREQLVGDLTDAFERIRGIHGSGWPSMISLVTGPSRTGDIERILVLGAHGPKKLTVLMW